MNQSRMVVGWRTRVLRARDQHDLHFRYEVEVRIRCAGQEYICEVADPHAVAHGASPGLALAGVIAKLRAEVDELRRAFTHMLPPERIARKRALLGSVDPVASRLLEDIRETPSHAWVMGWLERRDAELVFVSSDDEVYALDARYETLPADERLRFARVRTGEGGQSVGPVEVLEEPCSSDPEEIWRCLGDIG